jgi:protein tyrosine/serine phosphatase
MIVGNNLSGIGFWLVRGLLMSVVFLTVATSACRQAPNVFLFGSMNTTRTAHDQATNRWAEPMQAPGLPNLYKVSQDLYRGARPTAEGLQELQSLGIKTVVNLEQANGEQAKLAELGLACEHIPMSALFVKDDEVVRFLQIAGTPGHAPVFVHCHRGADRTGLVCAIYRIAFQGWTKDEAIAEMTEGGFRFNHGYQNVVNYIRDVDIDQLKQRAGLSPALAESR